MSAVEEQSLLSTVLGFFVPTAQCEAASPAPENAHSGDAVEATTEENNANEDAPEEEEAAAEEEDDEEPEDIERQAGGWRKFGRRNNEGWLGYRELHVGFLATTQVGHAFDHVRVGQPWNATTHIHEDLMYQETTAHISLFPLRTDRTSNPGRMPEHQGVLPGAPPFPGLFRKGELWAGMAWSHGRDAAVQGNVVSWEARDATRRSSRSVTGVYIAERMED
ncbi:hypothetical protein QFC22_004415 [Naganishia vaughanmartiniae]|uniref:Uncharacterized protein n=1 Tax=Naganishia vaughanmartiniae TaxID=1424756 RepID=A0ACC2X0J5_9TREE|nr:hypothetical protein QFC22_004415 [Naganishia vaughanmartiniae]